MKLKLNRIFYFGIIIQIISTQGLLIFIALNTIDLWELKTIFHPISFVLIFAVFVIKSINSIKITLVDFITLLYFVIMFGFLIFNVDSLSKGYLTFREVYFVFILTFIYNQIKITENQWNKILKLLYIFCILNIFFVLWSFILGPEEYMTLLTGRYQWGTDEIFKFQISNFQGFLRSPGIVGSSGALAYFALFTYMLMDNNDKYKKKKYLALFLLIISFTRSALLGFMIYVLFNFILKKENIKKVVLAGKYLIPIFIVGIIVLSQYGLLSMKSIFIRIHHWINNINVEFNPIFGGSIGKVGGSVRGQGVISVLDNYWLMMFCSTGIIGIGLTLLFFYEKSKPSRKLMIALLAVSVSGIFITLTQAIPFLVLFPLLFISRNFSSNKTELNINE